MKQVGRGCNRQYKGHSLPRRENAGRTKEETVGEERTSSLSSFRDTVIVVVFLRFCSTLENAFLRAVSVVVLYRVSFRFRSRGSIRFDMCAEKKSHIFLTHLLFQRDARTRITRIIQHSSRDL